MALPPHPSPARSGCSAAAAPHEHTCRTVIISGQKAHNMLADRPTACPHQSPCRLHPPIWTTL